MSEKIHIWSDFGHKFEGLGKEKVRNFYKEECLLADAGFIKYTVNQDILSWKTQNFDGRTHNGIAFPWF